MHLVSLLPFRCYICFGRLAEQTPLTGYEPKSLIEVIPINKPSRKGSLDTNLEDLATTSDASEVYNTKNIEQLTSPLFSQEREVSANQFGVSTKCGTAAPASTVQKGPVDQIRKRGRWICKQYSAPRASFTCHTHTILFRVHVTQVLEPSSGQDRWIVVLASLQKPFHPIHVSLHLA